MGGALPGRSLIQNELVMVPLAQVTGRVCVQEPANRPAGAAAGGAV